MYNKLIIKIFLFIFALPCFGEGMPEDPYKDILNLSIEQLAKVRVTTASGISESILEAPAAMLVLDQHEIVRKGYNNIAEIIADLPGFDVVAVGGASGKINAYQRGYRTPLTARTLIMLDGIVNNNLWEQQVITGQQYAISNIERIEVLYGPASVLYGPNAFLGIINIISKKGRSLADGEHELSVRGEIGSWQSRGAELHARGHHNNFDYSITGRIFHSDEEDLSDRWGFLSNELAGDPDIWGPMLQLANNGEQYGQYNNDTDDWSLIANLGYQNWQAGISVWQTDQGYGAQFAADRGQSNADWQRRAEHYFVKNSHQLTSQISMKSSVLYRADRVFGDWVEAEQDWRAGMQDHAFISRTHWNSNNNALEVKQEFDVSYNDNLRLKAGWRYKNSDLTRAYDVPGYWSGSFSSGSSAGDTGPHGFGAGIYHSTDPVYDFFDLPKQEVPTENRIKFKDWGGYINGIYNTEKWRFNLGIRHDDNEVWGSSLNPRLSAVYKFNNKHSAIKLIYGEAFQEPAAKQLYGGWSGRRANPDLQPEEASNIELIYQHQNQFWLNDISLYVAEYKSVIRENAVNDAHRDIWGLEYRGKFNFTGSDSLLENISGHLYYTYTEARTDQQYDHDNGEWIEKDGDQGDIAPHKVNLSLDYVIANRWNLNLNANFYSRTKLYSRNPLTIKGHEVGSRVIYDSVLSYRDNQWQVFFKILNIFDREILAPGINNANSGDDFSQRSKGYDNSLQPQPGRSLWLTVSHSF